LKKDKLTRSPQNAGVWGQSKGHLRVTESTGQEDLSWVPNADVQRKGVQGGNNLSKRKKKA